MAVPFQWICEESLSPIQEISRQPTYAATHLPSPGDWDYKAYRPHVHAPLDYAIWSIIISSHNPSYELDPQRYEYIPVTHIICFWHRVLYWPGWDGPGNKLKVFGRSGHWYESTRHLGWGGTQTPFGPREIATGDGSDPFGDPSYNPFAEGRLYDIAAMEQDDAEWLKRYDFTPGEHFPFTPRASGSKDLFIETNEISISRPSKRRKLLEDFYMRDPSAGPIDCDILPAALQGDEEQPRRKAGNEALLDPLPTPEEIGERIGQMFRPTLKSWSDSEDDCITGSEESDERNDSGQGSGSDPAARDVFWDQWEEVVDDAWRHEELEDVCLDEITEMGHWLDEALTVRRADSTPS